MRSIHNLFEHIIDPILNLINLLIFIMNKSIRFQLLNIFPLILWLLFIFVWKLFKFLSKFIKLFSLKLTLFFMGYRNLTLLICSYYILIYRRTWKCWNAIFQFIHIFKLFLTCFVLYFVPGLKVFIWVLLF